VTLNGIECIIRNAKLEDLNQVVIVEKQSFPPDEVYPPLVFTTMLKLNPELFIVIDCGGVVKGYAMGFANSSQCHLMSIAVSPDIRGLGLGRMLLRSFEDRCRERRLTEVVLEVRVDNSVALNLYRSEGYRVEGLLLNYYPNGSNAYMMRKIL